MVNVVKVRLEDGYAGCTDGETIWLDDRLNAVQMLCALLHEMVHIEWGHKSHQVESVEMAVRYEVARRLLPLDRIVGVCKDGKSIKSLAVELGVTQQVLMDRAATLTDEQAEAAGCWECRKCPVIAARLAGRPSKMLTRAMVAIVAGFLVLGSVVTDDYSFLPVFAAASVDDDDGRHSRLQHLDRSGKIGV